MLYCQLWASQAKASPVCSNYIVKPILLLLYSLCQSPYCLFILFQSDKYQEDKCRDS